MLCQHQREDLVDLAEVASTPERFVLFKFRDIIDGTSNTLMFGERRWQHKTPAGTFQIDGAAIVFGILNTTAATVDPTLNVWVGAVVGSTRSRINYDGTNASNSRFGNFSSYHPGGAQFALADGSVKFVTETVEFSSDAAQQNATLTIVDSVFERMLSRDDGQPFEMP